MRRLLEWKDAKGNPVYLNNKTSSAVSNTNNTSTGNFPSQVENYNKILTAIRIEKVFNYSSDNINRLSDRILDVDLERNGKREIGLSIVYRPTGPNYIVTTYDADDDEMSKDVCASFEEVIDVLFYDGIIEDKTLCESASELTEWKYMNPPASNSNSNIASKSSTLNYPSQEERYKKLLAQIDKEKRFTYEVITLTDNALVFNLIDPNNNNKITAIAVVYKPWTNPPVWVMAVGSGKGVDYKDWNEVLEIFEVPGIIKDISSLKESLATKVPSKLYHATYKQFLNSIKKKGLGNTKKKMWSDSKPGVVYLADDPWTAESYAEESEYIDSVEDPDDYLDNIIILEVDTSKLDSSKLYIDENVLLDADEENSTWEYHGIIPWEAIKIFNSSIAEDFEVYNTLWK